MHTTSGRLATGVGAIFFLLPGAWALVDPTSFYDQVAPWPPYNEHFLHDIGAFQIGIGIALVVVLFGVRGNLAVLAGAASAASLHALSHVVDYGDGGRSSDPYLLSVIAILLILALLIEGRSSA
jgi:hypothetical protein